MISHGRGIVPSSGWISVHTNIINHSYQSEDLRKRVEPLGPTATQGMQHLIHTSTHPTAT